MSSICFFILDLYSQLGEEQIILSEVDENEELVPLLMTNSIKTEIVDEGKELQEKMNDLFRTEDENGSIDATMAQLDEGGSENILQRPPLTNPTISLRHRVLGLSQKGDWDACEVTLKMLENQATEEHNSKPLENVTDEVIQ